jgi:hypothetical protein
MLVATVGGLGWLVRRRRAGRGEPGMRIVVGFADGSQRVPQAGDPAGERIGRLAREVLRG